MTPSPNPLPQGGEGFIFLSPLPVGEGLSEGLVCFLKQDPLLRQDRDHRVPLVQCAIYGRDGCAFIEAVGVVIGGVHEHAR